MNAGDELDQFVEEMLTAKELSGVTDEVRAQLVRDMKKQLLDQINRALINALPDDKVAELSSMLDDNSVDESSLQQFIVDAGVDVRQVTARTMLQFRDLYIRPQSQKAE